MHSSRMRTVRRLTVSRGRRLSSKGGMRSHNAMGRQTPRGQTYVCENIIFPQLRLSEVTIESNNIDQSCQTLILY